MSAMLLLGFTGCGNDTKSSNVSYNDAGKYGTYVLFGDIVIAGTWIRGTGSYKTFNDNGIMYYESEEGYRHIYPEYGVNEDGTVLTTIASDNSIEHYIFVDSNESCFTAKREISPSYQPTEVYCRYEREPATLSQVNNSGNPANDLGFFGEGVLYGNDSIVGHWWYAPVLGGDGAGLDFSASGDGNKYLPGVSDTGNPFEYGISEEGRTLNIHYTSDTNVNNYEITGLLEGCYQMEHDGTQYKLCKSK